MVMEDSIVVSQIELFSHVGVPSTERTATQRLTVSLRLIPLRGFAALHDDLANTVDYAAVCDEVRHEAEVKSRHLIETLADDVASALLDRFPLRAVEVEVRKYVLAGTEYAAVSIRREREE